MKFLSCLFCLLLAPAAYADVSINEIMYDLSGSDTDREWIEVQNDTANAVDLTKYKFFEANTNHGIATTTAGQSGLVPVGGYAVIADMPAKFLIDWPNFAGALFDSSFSLSNTGETIAMKNGTTTVTDQVTYQSAWGAGGDGNSLQKVSGAWTARSPTPGALNSPAGSPAGTPENGNSTASSTPTATTTLTENVATEPAVSGGNGWPVEPRIFAHAIGPSSAIAGADVLFKGQVVGLQKEPIENARLIWSFGDGATKEGKQVLHGYARPGIYIVVLDASSGPWQANDRLRVEVVAPVISIEEVVPGFEGGVGIRNRSDRELDFSWWRLQIGDKFFTLPQHTIVVTNSDLFLAVKVTGLPANETSYVALLYPNGEIATVWKGKQTVSTSAPTVVSNPRPIGDTVVPKKVIAPVAVAETKKAEVKSQELAAAVGGAPAAALSGGSSYGWLFGALGIAALGLGAFLSLKVNVSPKSATASLADEIEIIE